MRSKIYQPKNLKQSQRVSLKPASPSRLLALPLRMMLFGVVMISGLGYLILSNHVATKGFAMKDLQTKIDSLTETNEQLEVRVMDLKSLGNVKDASANLDLVSVSKMEYLSDVEPTFALGSE